MKGQPLSRRGFLSSTLAAASGVCTASAAAVPGPGAPQQHGPRKLAWEPKIAENINDVSDATLRWVAQVGHKHMVYQGTRAVDRGRKGYWSVEDIQIVKDKCNAMGLELTSMMIPIDFYRKAALGQPGRDQEIERIIRSVRAAGQMGVPVLEWRPVWPDFFWDERVGYRWAPGRGGARYKTFDYDRVKDLQPFEGIGRISAEELWDRQLYFARPIVAAAEEAGVKLSCHPNDPPVPSIRGCARILVTIEDLERFLDEIPSPANGITFCQGTITEMGGNIFDNIRRIGGRGKIHHVHFRSVRGTVPQYTEVFIDEGDVDMLQAMKTYREVGYTGTIVSDHTPRMEGDTPFGHRGRSFSHGYIRALVQAVNAMA